MKIKEELAQAFATPERYSPNDSWVREAAIEGYLAGFEMARKIIAIKIECDCDEWCAGRPCNCSPEEILEIGEEEVSK